MFGEVSFSVKTTEQRMWTPCSNPVYEVDNE